MEREFKRYELDWGEFAQALGYADEQELWDKMEEIYKEGDVSWYIAKLPDGRWITFDDAELALDRVNFFRTKREAKRDLAEAWRESKS